MALPEAETYNFSIRKVVKSRLRSGKSTYTFVLRFKNAPYSKWGEKELPNTLQQKFPNYEVQPLGGMNSINGHATFRFIVR